ncbi:hypothetical protein BKA64DRAFT_649605 [Cadophora sp. MPI-SDFR-AT-0126]|nr:hypothetical protein BKA64DRAFT_649605 [Leotiomycetes sp. MPI-SDFR-AT-0126]
MAADQHSQLLLQLQLCLVNAPQSCLDRCLPEAVPDGARVVPQVGSVEDAPPMDTRCSFDHPDMSNWTAATTFVSSPGLSRQTDVRERRRLEKHTKELYIAAYRLLSWPRYVHRLSTARSSSG